LGRARHAAWRNRCGYRDQNQRAGAQRVHRRLAALIVASAIEAGCDTLFTEDMPHDRKFGRLAIVNPFLKGAP
jgi:predicted nucleic acid-binding protein